MQAVLSLYRTTIGRKVAMAVTGAIYLGFVLAHMLGHLIAFAGSEAYNAYAATLQANAGVVWTVRIVLLAAIVIHIASAVSLLKANAAARPKAYAGGRKDVKTTAAAKTMRFGGIFLLFFLVYHILHLTVGAAHPDFVKGDVYGNMVTAFTNPLVTGVYLLAMGALFLHLQHGTWSFLQTLGFGSPDEDDPRKKVAMAFATVVTLGFVAVPVAILVGVIS